MIFHSTDKTVTVSQHSLAVLIAVFFHTGQKPGNRLHECVIVHDGIPLISLKPTLGLSIVFGQNDCIWIGFFYIFPEISPELMIIFNVRTSKKPFIESNASSKLNYLTIFSLVLTIFTPILLHKIPSFHFEILPPSFYFYLIILVLFYFFIVSIIKKIYIKKYHEWL